MDLIVNKSSESQAGMEENMQQNITMHKEEILRLKKIEGQVRGVQKMIQDGRYCIDILTQLSSIVGAIKSVEENIMDRHLKGCVRQSFDKGNRNDRQKKIDEVITVLKKFRKY